MNTQITENEEITIYLDPSYSPYSTSTGYSCFLEGTIVRITEKAICFRPRNARNNHSLWLPKKTITADREFEGCYRLAKWFTPDNLQKFIMNKYCIDGANY